MLVDERKHGPRERRATLAYARSLSIDETFARNHRPAFLYAGHGGSVSWPEALDRIATQFMAIAAESGPDAVAVMNATRTGKGCGSCKSLVGELVAWLCGGEIEDDPAVHYYVPSIPLRKPELIAAIREQALTSVSKVFAALAGGVEDPANKPALASLLATPWNKDYEDERDARFSNDRVHGNIQKDGTFSVVPEMPGGVCTPAELKRIADVAVKYEVPLVKLTGGQRIDLVGIPKDQLPGVWNDLGMPAGSAWGKSYRTRSVHRHRFLSFWTWRQHGA